MAILAFQDAVVTINSVALSDHSTDVSLTYEAADLTTTAFGSTTTTRIAGNKDWKLTVTFNQDFASSNVDATLFPLVGAAPFAVSVKATSSATSATNPLYSGNVILKSYSPISGKQGELLGTQAEFLCAGALSRATS